MRALLRFSLLTSLIGALIAAPVTAQAADKSYPLHNPKINIYHNIYVVSAQMQSGTCFKGGHLVFRGPDNKIVNHAIDNTKIYPFVYLDWTVLSNSPSCVAGGNVTYSDGPGVFLIKVAEIRDYATKEVLWSAALNEITAVPTSDPPLENPLFALTAVRTVPPQNDSPSSTPVRSGPMGVMDLIEISFSPEGTSSIRPLTTQNGYAIIGRTKDALLVQSTLFTGLATFAEIWIVTASGWKFWSKQGSGLFSVRAITLSTDRKSALSLGMQGGALASIEKLQSVGGPIRPPKVFETSKNGGGFICGLINDSVDKYAYFTQITKTKTYLYQADLRTLKIKRLGATENNFCLETFDSSGNMVGEARSTSASTTAHSIMVVSSSTYKIMTEIPTSTFDVGVLDGHSIAVVDNLAVITPSRTNSLEVINLTTNEVQSTIESVGLLNFLTALPPSWIANTARPALHD